jgi:hypothetical protein
MNLDILLSVMQRSSYGYWFKSRVGIEVCAFLITASHITLRHERDVGVLP